MRIIVMITMLSILAGLFANAGRQIYLWLKLIFGGINKPLFGVLFGAAVLAVLAAFVVSRIPGMGNCRRVFRIAHYGLGILCYVVMIANIAGLLLFVGRRARLVPSPVPRPVSLTVGAVSLILAAILTVYGAIHAGNIRVSRYNLSLGREADSEGSLRIALVSDIHLGYVIGEEHLAKVVAAVNEIQPDLVCIAGDIFDGDMTALSDPLKLQALFGSIESEYGVYACLGNHDAGATYREMLAFLDGAGVRVLMDEAAVIDGRFVLAGRRDSFPIGNQGEPRKRLERLPEESDLPLVVLDHQPGNIGEYGGEADLILCGHTHRGQMFPFNLVTDAVFDVDYGYYRAGNEAPKVIVTSGAGTWGPPLRVGTDNEVVEINLSN